MSSTAKDPGAAAPRRRRMVLGAGIFLWLAATGCAWWAGQAGQPLTAAIVYLIGIILIGALAGLRGGLVAAIGSSLFYNFFVSDPVFRFSLSTTDEYVTLLAFNASAVASGLIAGRLRDRALAAEAATRRIRALLAVSERLQGAIEADAVPQAAAGFPGAGPVALWVARDERLEPVAGAGDGELALALWTDEGVATRGDGRRRAYLLATRAGRTGVVVLDDPAASPRSQGDASGLVNLLGLALERCVLRERLAEAELVRRSEELKTALLSSVSHDLRTPLGAISASASSLLRYGRELGEETSENLLRVIREQCDRLNRYTTNLLNLGRLQAGVDPRHFTRCDALEVLGVALANVRAEAGEREFRKDYGGAAATLVRADPVMLEQIFFNILDNAVRYSPEGSPVLIRARSAAGQLSVSISDCGPGIDPEEGERVFERFYRSKAAAGRQGSGLGLSIARGFTLLFGGAIEALAGEPPFAGATIRVTLPSEADGAVAA